MSAIIISGLEEDIPNCSDHPAHLAHETLWKKQDKIVNNRIHALDFTSLLPTDGTLVVTTQYQLFAERIHKILADVPAFFGDMHGGICIIGNPGAGKSVFLDYYYVYRLTKGLPVVYYNSGGLAIHIDDQCYAIGATNNVQPDIFASSEWQGVPILIDSETLVTPPPNWLVGLDCEGFPIQAASPNDARYKKWTEARTASQWVLDPPVVTDLSSMIYDKQDPVSQERLQGLVDKWGRNIRTLRTVIAEGEENALINLEGALKKLSVKELGEITASPVDIPTSFSHSHSIITTFRQPTRELFAVAHVMMHRITSNMVWRMLTIVLIFKRKQDLEALYSTLTCSTGLGAARGQIFESLAHGLIVVGTKTFRVTPMYQKKKGGTLIPKAADEETIKLGNIATPFLYSSSMLTSATRQAHTYFIPTEHDNPTFDAFAIFDKHGAGFQMTVGRTHGLNVKGLSLLSARLKHLKPPHRFYFVIPQGSQFSVPAPSVYWMKKFTFHTLEIETSWTSRLPIDLRDVGGPIDRMCDGNPELPTDAKTFTREEEIEMEMDVVVD